MNKPRAQRPASGNEWFRRTVLVICAILMALVSLEFAVRASNWGYLFAYPNFVLMARTALAERDDGRYVHDPELGHVPRAGYSAAGTTIEADGLRRTSSEKEGEQVAGAPTPGSILAVGDSFTYGDEVDDGQAWPAQLQRLTGRRVLNAGVSGYGFDQIVLRAERLAAKYKPSVIVASFIADDIRRTEMRRLWSADKPYFVVEDGKLALRGVPVPRRADAADTLTFWQRTLGYSYLFDFVLRRLDLLYDWYGDHQRVQASGTGERLSCLLAERLGALQKQSGAKVIVLAEYDPVVWDDPAFAAAQRRLTKGLLDCAARNGLATIDSFDAMVATGAPRKLYVMWHMNEPGNRLIADLVAGALR